MKVLYIGNQRELTGWGDACYNNILAMHKAGINICCQNISFGSRQRQCDELSKIELYGNTHYDVIIQHTLPHYFAYVGPAKNIGMYEVESTFSNGWNKYINLMDECWVSCKKAKLQSEVSRVDKPIKIIHHCIDTKKYINIKKTAKIEELNNSYNFVFVGELSKRKNIVALLKAFHTEFHPSENVNLFIKTSSSHLSHKECYDLVMAKNFEIINGLKIRNRYKEPIIYSGHYNHNDLLSIMSQCHCFVCPSYGEAWCYPALEAMALGLNIIYTANIGVEEFATHSSCFAAKSQPERCLGMVNTFDTLYNSHDFWDGICVESLMSCMRMSYEQRNDIDRESIIKHTENFSHEVVGQKIKAILEC